MKRCILGGVAALLMAVPMIAAAPPAVAGCVYGGPVLGKCDGPIQPDGTWERCVVVAQLIPRGASSYLVPARNCQLVGPGRQPADPNFADPPVHIAG
jgi:hypothetical protein